MSVDAQVLAMHDFLVEVYERDIATYQRLADEGAATGNAHQQRHFQALADECRAAPHPCAKWHAAQLSGGGGQAVPGDDPE